MAHYKFVVLSAETSLKEQSIFINCSLDIDEESINADNLFLLDNSTKAAVPFETEVDGRTIQLKLVNWASPNGEYTLFIEKGILSVTEQELESSIIRKLVFKSEVISDVKIRSPFNFEELSGETKITWYETGTKNPEKTYFIQIGKENAFYNIVYESFIDLTGEEIEEENPEDHIYSAVFKEIAEAGQYYVRIRAQRKDGQYGSWSKVVTFDRNLPKEETSGQIEPDDTPAPSEGPQIIDYTKEEPAVTFALEYERYTEDTPEDFEIKFPVNIDITEAEMIIKRLRL